MLVIIRLFSFDEFLEDSYLLFSLYDDLIYVYICTCHREYQYSYVDRGSLFGGRVSSIEEN